VTASRRGVLAGLAASGVAGAARAQAGLREITVPVSSFSFASAGARAARSLGLFARHGLQPRFVAMDSANAATSALIAGSAEVVVSGPGELVAAQARGQPVVLVADVYRGFGASLVLAKDVAERTGIPPAAPWPMRHKALDGLLIASASATSSYTASYRGAAEAAGARIRFTYMTQPAMVAALQSGAVQGMIASAPFWGFPVAHGAGVLWLSGPKGELPPGNMPASTTSLQAMRPFAMANPTLMQQLIDTMRDLADAVERSPREVQAAVAGLYPDVDAATMDVLFAAEARAWITRPMSPADMRHEIEFVRSGGVTMPGIDRIDPAAMLYAPRA
jgi:ABC-type nitrate/sulfonate/bicarbonate transport system substrate-binding protein